MTTTKTKATNSKPKEMEPAPVHEPGAAGEVKAQGDEKPPIDEGAEILIGLYCEDLCDAVAEVSALQARILRATYRDKLTDGEVARITGLSMDRNKLELVAAFRTMVSIITEGALAQWETPPEELDYKRGESLRDLMLPPS